MKSIAVLHNIRSVINVGAIFRTCDAADISKLFSQLKNVGYKIIAIEQSPKSIDYKKVAEIISKDKSKEDLVFVVGNEVEGLSKEILEKCDLVAEIPMKGSKESLNVATAFGIAVFRILNL